MHLISYLPPQGSLHAGVWKDGKIAGLEAAGFRSILALLQAGDEGLAKVREFLGKAEWFDAGAVRLAAPVPRPPKLICVGLNYLDHARESKMEVPQVPTIFNKFPSAVIGPGDAIVLPKNSTKPDYEAEFAFVIGKPARHVSEERALEYVAGYTIVNDVSARDFQMATTQWLMGKTFDTFAPLGPWIVTKDEIADPHALDISLAINGEVLQSSNTRELIFKIPQLIAYVSSVVTLEPGDVVSTGTPAGVGFGRKPPRWLRAGDECVISIAGIGELRNPVVAEA